MDLLSYMIQIRRELHRNPCLSGREGPTADYLASRLEELGYAPRRCGETGLFCDLVSDPCKPWLLFRADIDALPVREETGLPFASQTPGVMHACGHDGHAAILMGLARELRGKKLPRNIRFLFQPAEEIGGGAARMLEEGALPGNTAGVFAAHIWPSIPAGQIGLRRGTLMASNDRFTVRFHGHSAHCAMRREGRDALQAGVRMARELDRIPALLPPEEPALIFAGIMRAGQNYNIVAEDCELEGTVRTMSSEARDAAQRELGLAADRVGALCGVEAETKYVRQYPPLVCDGGTVNRLLELLPAAKELSAPFLTAEDFAFFTERAPGAMLLLGCRDEAHREPLHSAGFTFDESLLERGCKALLKIARAEWPSGNDRS